MKSAENKKAPKPYIKALALFDVVSISNRLFKWRRRESNSRPKILPLKLLHVIVDLLEFRYSSMPADRLKES